MCDLVKNLRGGHVSSFERGGGGLAWGVHWHGGVVVVSCLAYRLDGGGGGLVGGWRGLVVPAVVVADRISAGTPGTGREHRQGWAAIVDRWPVASVCRAICCKRIPT